MEALDPGTRIANVALAAVPCSNSLNTDAYAHLLIRPSEPLTTAARAYYLANPPLSTCGLTVLACWRVAGLADPLVTAPYYPDRIGKAFQDIEAIGAKYGAWEKGLQGDLQVGDVWIITKPDGSDAHTGICVCGEQPDGSVDTVEGGQFDGRGSTKIDKFTRKLSATDPAGHVWMGSRLVYGVVRAAKIPLA